VGIAYHTIHAPDGAGLNLFDRVTIGTITAVYPAAALTVTSTLAVSWTEPVATPYTAIMSPIEDCTYFITNKTTVGFTLNVNARLATNTLAGGSVEILLLA
jgi:hypothetical protein